MLRDAGGGIHLSCPQSQQHLWHQKLVKAVWDSDIGAFAGEDAYQ